MPSFAFMMLFAQKPSKTGPGMDPILAEISHIIDYCSLPTSSCIFSNAWTQMRDWGLGIVLFGGSKLFLDQKVDTIMFLHFRSEYRRFAEGSIVVTWLCCAM